MAVFCGFLAFVFLAGGCVSSASKPVFEPGRGEAKLAGLMVRRLELAREVAWSKFQNHAPVRDAKREAELLAELAAKGQEMGLAGAAVTDFFAAQITASRMVQAKLMREWKRGGVLPALPPRDLRHGIRPELDRIGSELLRELAALGSEARPGFAFYAEQMIKAQGFPADVARTAAAPLKNR